LLICHLLGHLQASCPHAHAPPRKKGTKTKSNNWNFSENDDDQNEDQQSQVSIGESTPPLGANVEDMDTKLSSSKELVPPKASLGGTRDFMKLIHLIQIKN
jgi:hypothetical protein